MTDHSHLEQSDPVSQCSACPVDTGECPRCGTFWWRRGGEKRYGMRPATKHDAARIRELLQRQPTGIVYWNELPNRIGPR